MPCPKGTGEESIVTKSIRFIVAAIAVIIAIFASAPAGAAPVEIAGDVTYYERIALPPAAVLQVQLLDLTLKGEPARIGAEAMIEGPGQVPLQFILSFDDDVLIAGHSYALVATIWAGEHIWFRNAAPHPIESPLSGLPVVIVVNFVGEPFFETTCIA